MCVRSLTCKKKIEGYSVRPLSNEIFKSMYRILLDRIQLHILFSYEVNIAIYRVNFVNRLERTL